MSAGLEISLRIGQHVRHRDFHGKRITGVVRGLSVDSEDVLHADIALDEAIVIPPINDDDRELRIYRQHVPAHELAPLDERDELMAEMLAALVIAREFVSTDRNALADSSARPDGTMDEDDAAALADYDAALLQIAAAIAKAGGAA